VRALLSPRAIGRIVEGMNTGEVRIDGNPVLLLWFHGLTRIVAPIGRSRRPRRPAPVPIRTPERDAPYARRPPRTAYDAALAYTGTRIQFGKPVASFQLVQSKLVQMLADVTAMQLYCLRVGTLMQQDQLTDTIAALAKLNNTVKARKVIADARALLGGNGLLLDHHVIRHMGDIEAIYTYEGTEEIQTLLVGRDITGISAFA
jgi:hypothetical protein